ncbi:MAG: type II secretion system minor pseudopilin GspK, partial [Pseudomonadota bacterium]
ETAALEYLRQNASVLDQPAAPLFREPVTLPLEEAVATLSFAEKSNCFNINDLVDQAEDGFVADEAAQERFAQLIVAVGGSRSAGEQMAARIADFMDSDNRVGTGGAEDFDYMRRPVPYRTSGSLMLSISELRVVEGFSRDVYRSLVPYLCALPTDGAGTLNINTLNEADAPLLMAATGNALTVDQARRLIRARPEQGYESVEAFLGDPALSGLDLPADTPVFLDITSGLVAMEVVLENAAGRLRQETLVSRRDNNVTVLERRVGERLP